MKKLITFVFAAALMLASVSAFAADDSAQSDTTVKQETTTEVKPDAKADSAKTEQTTQQPVQTEVKPN
ncbi:MAG: hypothetical protein AB7F25_08255 [Deferribacterales bacterium]